jgi:hypothetical protein
MAQTGAHGGQTELSPGVPHLTKQRFPASTKTLLAVHGPDTPESRSLHRTSIRADTPEGQGSGPQPPSVVDRESAVASDASGAPAAAGGPSEAQPVPRPQAVAGNTTTAATVAAQ